MKITIKTLAASLIMLMTCTMAMQAQLPAVQVKDASGRTIDASKINNGGKPFVVSFFATWCKPCLRELKAISEVYADWQEETGMKMYIVSIDDAQNTSKVKPYVDAEGWEYELLLDANNDLFRSMSLPAVPHVLVYDGKGNIIYSHSGYTDGSESEIIEAIRKLKK